MQVSSDLFTVNKTEKLMIAEMSDVQTRWIRVYPDACDIGLEVVSRKTGHSVRFAIEKEVYDNSEDHELQHIELVPTFDSVRREPAVKGWKIILFND